MSESEWRVKEKLAAVIERVCDDPSLIPEEWSTLFGDASVMRAMAIVSRLKGRPADEEKQPGDDGDGLIDPQEKAMLASWLARELPVEEKRLLRAELDQEIAAHDRRGKLDKPQP